MASRITWVKTQALIVGAMQEVEHECRVQQIPASKPEIFQAS